MKRKVPLTKQNYILFIIGILVIAAGYFFLSIGPHDSVFSLTIAPIMLLAGYVVILPMAIMKKFQKK